MPVLSMMQTHILLCPPALINLPLSFLLLFASPFVFIFLTLLPVLFVSFPLFWPCSVCPSISDPLSLISVDSQRIR